MKELSTNALRSQIRSLRIGIGVLGCILTFTIIDSLVFAAHVRSSLTDIVALQREMVTVAQKNSTHIAALSQKIYTSEKPEE